MSLPRSISAITLVADKFGLGGRAGLSRLDFVGFDSLCEACCGTEEFRQEEPSSQPALFSFSRIDVTLPPSAVRARFSVGFRIIANFSAPLSFRFRRPVGSPYARASGTLGAKGELRTGYRIGPDADHAEDATLDLWAEPETAEGGGAVGAGLEWRW